MNSLSYYQITGIFNKHISKIDKKKDLTNSQKKRYIKSDLQILEYHLSNVKILDNKKVLNILRKKLPIIYIKYLSLDECIQFFDKYETTFYFNKDDLVKLDSEQKVKFIKLYYQYLFQMQNKTNPLKAIL